MLTVEQIRSYQENGFLVVDNFFDPSHSHQLRERIEYLVEQEQQKDPVSIFDTDKEKHVSDEYFLNSGDKIRFFFEKKAFTNEHASQTPKSRLLNKVGHALHDLDPVFNSFSRLGQTKRLVEDLGLVDPLIVQSMYIFKQPFIGDEVSPHQDGTFLMAEPDTLIGLWFALEDSTLENGCLWAIPGGHNTPLKSKFVRKPEGGMHFIDFDKTPWGTDGMIPLEVKQGSVIVLHSRLPHMSLENRSAKSRHAYTLHFIDKKSHFCEGNWLRRDESMPFLGF
jgi:phytanoyl-CoA hydroxylase